MQLFPTLHRASHGERLEGITASDCLVGAKKETPHVMVPWHTGLPCRGFQAHLEGKGMLTRTSDNAETEVHFS